MHCGARIFTSVKCRRDANTMNVQRKNRWSSFSIDPRALNVVFLVLLVGWALTKALPGFIVRMFRDTANECAVSFPFAPGSLK
jgi:hypothetical protein